MSGPISLIAGYLKRQNTQSGRTSKAKVRWVELQRNCETDVGERPRVALIVKKKRSATESIAIYNALDITHVHAVGPVPDREGIVGHEFRVAIDVGPGVSAVAEGTRLLEKLSAPDEGHMADWCRALESIIAEAEAWRGIHGADMRVNRAITRVPSTATAPPAAHRARVTSPAQHAMLPTHSASTRKQSSDKDLVSAALARYSPSSQQRPPPPPRLPPPAPPSMQDTAHEHSALKRRAAAAMALLERKRQEKLQGIDEVESERKRAVGSPSRNLVTYSSVHTDNTNASGAEANTDAAASAQADTNTDAEGGIESERGNAGGVSEEPRDLFTEDKDVMAAWAADAVVCTLGLRVQSLRQQRSTLYAAIANAVKQQEFDIAHKTKQEMEEVQLECATAERELVRAKRKIANRVHQRATKTAPHDLQQAQAQLKAERARREDEERVRRESECRRATDRVAAYAEAQRRTLRQRATQLEERGKELQQRMHDAAAAQDFMAAHETKGELSRVEEQSITVAAEIVSLDAREEKALIDLKNGSTIMDVLKSCGFEGYVTNVVDANDDVVDANDNVKVHDGAVSVVGAESRHSSHIGGDDDAGTDHVAENVDLIETNDNNCNRTSNERVENKDIDRAHPAVESARITVNAKDDIIASAKLSSNLERKQLRERRQSLAGKNRINIVSSVKILAIRQSEDMAAIVITRCIMTVCLQKLQQMEDNFTNDTFASPVTSANAIADQAAAQKAIDQDHDIDDAAAISGVPHGAIRSDYMLLQAARRRTRALLGTSACLGGARSAQLVTSKKLFKREMYTSKSSHDGELQLAVGTPKQGRSIKWKRYFCSIAGGYLLAYSDEKRVKLAGAVALVCEGHSNLLAVTRPACNDPGAEGCVFKLVLAFAANEPVWAPPTSPPLDSVDADRYCGHSSWKTFAAVRDNAAELLLTAPDIAAASAWIEAFQNSANMLTADVAVESIEGRGGGEEAATRRKRTHEVELAAAASLSLPWQGWFEAEEQLAGVAIARNNVIQDMDGGNAAALTLFLDSSTWRQMHLPELPLTDGDPSSECGANIQAKGGRRLLQTSLLKCPKFGTSDKWEQRWFALDSWPMDVDTGATRSRQQRRRTSLTAGIGVEGAQRGMLYYLKYWTNETKMRTQQRKMLPKFEAGSSASKTSGPKGILDLLGNGIAAETVAAAAAGGGVIGSPTKAREHRRRVLVAVVSARERNADCNAAALLRDARAKCRMRVRARLRARHRGDDSERSSVNLAREASARVSDDEEEPGADGGNSTEFWLVFADVALSAEVDGEGDSVSQSQPVSALVPLRLRALDMDTMHKWIDVLAPLAFHGAKMAGVGAAAAGTRHPAASRAWTNPDVRKSRRIGALRNALTAYYQEFAPAQVSKLSNRFVDYYITKNEYLNRTLKFKYGVDLEGNTALWYGLTHETETSAVLTRADKNKRENRAAARLVHFWRKCLRGEHGGMTSAIERARKADAARALEASRSLSGIHDEFEEKRDDD